jgi:hypothetical protein
VLEAQESLRANIQAMTPAISLDTRPPSVGEWIHIVALSGLEFEQISPGSEGKNSIWKVATRPVIRVGRVVSHEPESMGHKGFCFTTTIPVSGGMSGGFAYVAKDGGTVAACGIVSTGPREEEGVADFRIAGHSTIVGVLGTLALQVPISTEPTYALLFDLVKSGDIGDIGGGGKNIELTKLEGGGFEIHRRDE